MQKVEYNENYKSIRWLAYFDLLGTKDLVREDIQSVFESYSEAITQLTSRKYDLVDVHPIWFSDTFLIYTDDISLSGFGELDHVSRWFCYDLINKGIPVRGAVSYGEFYIDGNNNLFFGDSLIEAYEYGEAQDWLGLILAPSATSELNKRGFFSGNATAYTYTEIPFKKTRKLQKDQNISVLPACILGCWLPWDIQDKLIQKLFEMKGRCKKEYAYKYKNTIDFMQQNPRYTPI